MKANALPAIPPTEDEVKTAQCNTAAMLIETTTEKAKYHPAVATMKILNDILSRQDETLAQRIGTLLALCDIVLKDDGDVSANADAMVDDDDNDAVGITTTN